jgi:hypothetical protein
MDVSGMDIKPAGILLSQKTRTDCWLNKINGYVGMMQKLLKL